MSTPQKSPFESNILRILRNEIQYQSEYAPPQQAAKKFDLYMVEDRPGEQWITLRGTSALDEDIKIEATMFHGLLVDISKGEGCDSLEFVCSAWPDCLEIQKVYFFKRDGLLAQPYMGPNLRNLDKKIQNALHEFLKARGVKVDLCVFLHEFMMKKGRTELIWWLGKIKSFVEK
ncbi:unnamed protein product [Ilex paraguariensis]|uniref:Mitochondrial glycoprotein n=1 Tax=Ilex paraguariensis TaxID=185542 RepID=A0ABC8UHL1_9AQUA